MVSVVGRLFICRYNCVTLSLLARISWKSASEVASVRRMTSAAVVDRCFVEGRNKYHSSAGRDRAPAFSPRAEYFRPFVLIAMRSSIYEEHRSGFALPDEGGEAHLVDGEALLMKAGGQITEWSIFHE